MNCGSALRLQALITDGGREVEKDYVSEKNVLIYSCISKDARFLLATFKEI